MTSKTIAVEHKNTKKRSGPMSYFWTHVNILHVVKYSTHKMERHKDSASNYNWVRGSTRDASRFYNT